MFDEMNKQERLAWVMAAGSAAIAVFMLKGFFALLEVKGGVLSTAPGLLDLALRATFYTIALEIAGLLVRRHRNEAVEKDERDLLIGRRATTAMLYVFGVLVSFLCFALAPFGILSTTFGIHAVDTSAMLGGLICLFAIDGPVRHLAQIYLYRWGRA